MNLSQERVIADRARAARSASAKVRAVLAVSGDDELKMSVASGPDERFMLLPREAAELLVEVLDALGDGESRAWSR